MTAHTAPPIDDGRIARLAVHLLQEIHHFSEEASMPYTPVEVLSAAKAVLHSLLHATAYQGE